MVLGYLKQPPSSEIISNAIKNRLSLIAINTKNNVLSDELKEL